ncbi:MAG: inositol monophosphatase family protein [Microthrixaceae bacterium]
MTRSLTDVALLELLRATADAVGAALDRDRLAGGAFRDKGGRPGQYRIDLVADDAALAVLRTAGVGILSEESGLEDRGSGVVVVVDPVDGSTNASRGLPWYATSLCAVVDGDPRVALVRNLATGTTWEARRGGGATRDGEPVRTSAVTRPGDAVMVLNGYAGAHAGWRQYRALGATALDLCAVGDGSVDATMDCTVDALGPWDYLGGALVLTEAGGRVADVQDRDLVVLDPAVRRTPVSAATPELFDAVLAARRALPPGRPPVVGPGRAVGDAP